MIVSFEHGFVFVKTLKTAGTSIEVDLSQVVEADAIVSPIFPAFAGHVARNHTNAQGKKVFFNHMRASEIRAKLGEDRARGLYFFCVERDPVEKCISHFHMLHNSPDHWKPYAETWEAYVEAGAFPVDVEKYAEPDGNGGWRRSVDRVLRYDRLAHDLPDLLATFGLPGFKLRSRAKSDYSRNRLLGVEDVTPAQRARIETAFAQSTDVSGVDWSRP